MSKYTLNDMAYNPEPLTFFSSDPGYRADDDELQKGFQKNRELVEQFRREYKGERKRNGEK